MKRFAFVIAFGVAACASTGVDPVIAKTCTLAGPTLNSLAQSGDPKIAQTAVFPAAYCQQLATGVVPPTTDSNTATWLPAAIGLAAKVAGVVIPLL